METRVTTVNIKAEPVRYKALMHALHNNTDYEGWHVMQYTECRNNEGVLVGQFSLVERKGPQTVV